MTEIGKKAPEFILKNVFGKDTKLSDLTKNGFATLIFYRGSWCPKCNLQLAAFEQDYEKFRKLNSELVGISTDAPEEAKKTLEEANNTFPLLLDPASKVIESYDIKVEKRELIDIPAKMYNKKDYAMPSIFIVDKEGILRYKYVGTSYRDRPTNELILTELKKLNEEINITV